MSRRRRTNRRRRTALVVTLALIPVLVVAGLAALVGAAVHAFDDATATSTPSSEPAYDAEQLANAATIVRAGADLGLSVRDQTIAVMTAMGESSLRNLDYGDWETSGVRNPDGTPTTSIGLFQQQDSWGTREQRLDPYTAATLFYRAMIERVPDRDALAPTEVAHLTQVNQDADHYAPYWEAAVSVVARVTGETEAPAAFQRSRDGAASQSPSTASAEATGNVVTRFPSTA